MDFFESQHRARRRTGRLLVLYVLAVAAMIASVYLAILFIARWAGITIERAHPLWHAETFFAVGGITVLLILLGSIYRIVQLRAGGSSVARMLGGRRVDSNTTDLDEQRLVNVVEEMAIAAGVPVPEIFVLDQESGINAFAAGYTPSDAAVAVTKACMQQLTRDELQGVIAHEFSHILNGDMRLNIRLIGVLNGIFLLHLIGYMIVRSLRFTPVSGGSRRSGKGEGNVLFFIIAIGFALMIIGYIGVIFARMIQAAVSRQREFLADAAAVQFTRNPGGISGALKKIGGSSFGSRVCASHAMEASHMFFANGIVSSLSNIFATHPPLVKRIRAIEPSFDGKSWIIPAPKKKRPAPPKTFKRPEPKSPFDPITQSFPMKPEVLLATIGTLDAETISRAERLMQAIPESLKQAARDTAGAEAAVYALLLSADPELKERQLGIVRDHSLAAVVQEVNRHLATVRALPPEARLPLVDLAIPALRQLSPAQFNSFRQAVVELIASDDQVTLFEYALEKVILRHLEQFFHEGRRPAAQFYAAGGLTGEFSLLLSALAHVGDKNTQRAFAAGVLRLPQIGDSLRMYALDECTLDRIDAALRQLDLASYPVKKQLLDAAIAVIASDAKIATDEAELLRAIADTLDCPMPPLA